MNRLLRSTLSKILFLFTICMTAPLTLADDATSANVMAPLEVTDWTQFQNQLTTAANIGITAVSVDVWWGKVEGLGDQNFNWSYYDTIFTAIESAGLHIVPIMSFHQCGGNVGDVCNIPIPAWIWNHYNTQGVYAADLKYKSEYGNESIETVSLWADAYVLSEYQEFMEAFENHFATKANIIDEINISMGPAGELRYPSYNSHDNGLTGYPTRGGFQSYSEVAKESFRQWALAKYSNLNGINNAWGLTLTQLNQVTPPSNGDFFIYHGDQYNTQYGRDYIRWYHDALIDHGKRMIDTALVAFNGAFANIELGYKIPGVHWKMAANDNSVRSAEMAAGLIPSDINLTLDSTGHGYADIVGLAALYSHVPRGIILHFTALEMDDNPNGGESLAKSLVFWVANEAQAQSVIIKGENALAGGVTTASGWNNIENAFTWASYSGMTVLRINQVTNGGIGQSRYANFINHYLVTSDWQRTVVFIYGQTNLGQDLFIRGGIDHTYANTYLGRNCQIINLECAIPIVHNNLLNAATAPWKFGDFYLDWYGAESGQSSSAFGTPLDWTTNNISYWASVTVDGYGYTPLNTFGEHYWMMDVQMDCSTTANGWFELTSYISNGPGWENNITQPGAPYSSNNHFGKCGHLNVFTRNQNTATISNL